MDETRKSQQPKKCPCGGEYSFSASCGADICVTCGQHKGLARCFCGWAVSGQGNGRRELEEMGEQIDDDY